MTGKHKTVRFIIGPPHCGKTTFRKESEELCNLPYLDVFDVQDQVDEEIRQGKISFDSEYDKVWESYLRAKDKLLEMLDEYDDVVFEHTLLKQCRRPMFVDAVRENHPDAYIACYYVYPALEEYKKRYGCNGFNENEKPEDDIEKIMYAIEKANYNHCLSCFDTFETPSLEEGFDEIVDVENAK